MKKYVLSIIPIMLALAPIGTSASEQAQENCSVISADEPGWSIETCGNGEITHIGPDGQRCVANEASSVTSCEGSDGTISRINPAD